MHELFGFFFAGMKTIQYSTMNMIYYLTRHTEFKQKLLAELSSVTQPIGDDLVNKLDYETVQDLNYLQCCYYESLRMEAPAAVTLISTVLQDTTIGQGDLSVHMKKGMIFLVLLQEIHKDPTQWISPHEYNPARFETGKSDNKWLYKPDGTPRNPLAFTPFYGGKRICLGKTFAE